jgi:2-oxoglutarate dehydrogenase E2 component (dihydrolipoamide succinyltransferase)
MPQLGESVTEGTVLKWLKAVGDHVAEDELLLEVSTDKTDSEVPSPAAGYLTSILVPEGDTVDVGTVLAVLSDTPGTAASGAQEEPTAVEPAAPVAEPAAPAAPAPTAPAPAATAPAGAPTAAPTSPTSAVPLAPAASGPSASAPLLSPLVRRLIEENQLDATKILGTGVGGRITRDDVLAELDRNATRAPVPGAAPAPTPAGPAAASAPATVRRPQPFVRSGATTAVALSNIRKRTGEHMVRSLATSPHVITAIDVDYEAVERARKPAREAFKAEEGFSLTYLPFIARAVVDAIVDFPYLNATVGEGELLVHTGVNLSIAVDLDFEGLLAPVIQEADSRRLRSIAREIDTLAQRARSRQLGPDDLSGGTFTISNSGSFGTFLVAPIINQPQVAIVSTDGVKRRPVVVTTASGEEAIAIHSVGNLTLSWDHRAFDGAYAAAFMARVKEILETRDWSAEL